MGGKPIFTIASPPKDPQISMFMPTDKSRWPIRNTNVNPIQTENIGVASISIPLKFITVKKVSDLDEKRIIIPSKAI